MDGGKIIYLVDKEVIKDLKFPTYRFDNTAQGKFMLSIAFSQSKYYVDNLSENIKRGIRQKIRNGIFCGPAPVGYLNDTKTRTVVVDKNKSHLVRKLFELYATGITPLKV
jgi:DNA invertase Pin-like site-specific DNA recombinase